MGNSAARDMPRESLDKRKVKIGDITLDSTARQARYDAAKIKKLKIKSPDVSKMHKVTYGNTTYYFRNKKKMNSFIAKDKHHEILGVNLDPEDRHKPTINQRFSKLSQTLDEYESEKLSIDQRIDGQEGFSDSPSEED